MSERGGSTVEVVRALVDKQLNFAVHGFELKHDDDLWNLGMTSLTCLGLMLGIEDAFDVELPESLLKEDTFRSVDSITAAVDGALGGGAGAGTGEAARPEEVPAQT
ncbi:MULTISPECIES: phosphopantetheine-binding protein [Actinosynnema]|uniref:phosphopantetheine-binding protein n=1 Tax=Actinosynnema TaxID=40566 RepID=UPI0020A360A2|nr:phosphopantetheine-binding protein [Actinosynnema pretiosum]MCP2097796.1 Phosphopantetheine attachment site [Actinosynnema pretiosum]